MDRPSAEPLVSVLTPSLNQVRWLGDNLASVAAQDYMHIEHVVMDGGSTDGSAELLAEVTDPKVTWRSEPDGGQAEAINKAFDQSRGEIIGWLNSDDAYFARDTVSVVVDAFRQRPEVDVVYGHAALVNENGLVLQVTWAPPMRRRVLPVHNFIIQPTAFIRRTAIEDQLVDPRFQSMMDRELWLRLAERNRFLRLNRILAVDRHQAERKTTLRPDLAAEDERLLESLGAIPSDWWVRPARKVGKVAFRIAGLGRLREVSGASLAFGGRRDGLLALALRQVATPRAWMPDSGAPATPDDSAISNGTPE